MQILLKLNEGLVSGAQKHKRQHKTDLRCRSQAETEKNWLLLF
jgi:hypothetical protein